MKEKGLPRLEGAREDTPCVGLRELEKEPTERTGTCPLPIISWEECELKGLGNLRRVMKRLNSSQWEKSVHWVEWECVFRTPVLSETKKVLRESHTLEFTWSLVPHYQNHLEPFAFCNPVSSSRHDRTSSLPIWTENHFGSGYCCHSQGSELILAPEGSYLTHTSPGLSCHKIANKLMRKRYKQNWQAIFSGLREKKGD